MFINLAVLSAASEMRVARATSSTPCSTRHSLVFTVEPAENEYLALETGEIFQAPSYARIRGNEDKVIAATFAIHGFDNPQEHESSLRYWKPSGSDFDAQPSELGFQFCMAPSDFEYMAADLRAGVCPCTISVELDASVFDKDSKLGYGWEPDGSGKKWKNSEEHPKLPIVAISLRQQIRPASESDADGESVDFENVRQVNEAIITRLDKLIQTVSRAALAFAAGFVLFVLFGR